MNKENIGDNFYCATSKGRVTRVINGVKMVPERKWIGLTDDEIEGAIDEGFAFGLDDGNVSNKYVIRYVRVIEALLKEKNSD